MDAIYTDCTGVHSHGGRVLLPAGFDTDVSVVESAERHLVPLVRVGLTVLALLDDEAVGLVARHGVTDGHDAVGFTVARVESQRLLEAGGFAQLCDVELGRA